LFKILLYLHQPEALLRAILRCFVYLLCKNISYHINLGVPEIFKVLVFF